MMPIGTERTARRVRRGALLLSLAALCSLGLAGQARAVPAVDAWWGNYQGAVSGSGGSQGGLFMGTKNGVALSESGDVYVADAGNNRIQRFDGTGRFALNTGRDRFISAWGRDVDAGGSDGYEICLAPVGSEADHCKAAAASTGLGGEMSGPTGVAVNRLTGHVYVVDAGNNRIQEFEPDGTFVRAFGKDVVKTGEPGDTVGGTFEVCEDPEDCQAGSAGTEGGDLGPAASVGTIPGYISTAPPGAENEGNLLLADARNLRVQEFEPDGTFVRAFGKDVVETGGDGDTVGGGFEVCTVASECQAGSDGSGVGEFRKAPVTNVTWYGPTRVAQDPQGRIYTVEPGGNFRVQRFVLDGGTVSAEGEFAADTLHGSLTARDSSLNADNTTEIAVDDSGRVYVVKAFPFETGVPPVAKLAFLEAGWQQRILRLDPVSGEVEAVMAPNTGWNEGRTPLGTLEGVAFGQGQGNLTALIAAPTGTPIYAGAGSGSSSRVYRLNEIADLGATGVEAVDVGATSATLKAAVTPAPIQLDTFYRFEYSADGVVWKVAPSVDKGIGNAEAPGTSGNCPNPAATTCNVAEEIGGLIPNTTYQLRLVLRTSYNAGYPVVIDGPDFTPVPAPPVVKTNVARWSSPAPTGPSLFLSGEVNPGNERATYWFHYVEEDAYQADLGAGGDGFAQATTIPAAGGEAGRGLISAQVHEVVAGLDPARSYRYRLSASNSMGVASGQVRTIVPPQPGERYMEWVSNGDSWGAGIAALGGLSGDGERVQFFGLAFGNPRSVPGLGTPYLAERTGSGWRVPDTSPDPDRATKDLNAEAMAGADLGQLAWVQTSVGEKMRGEGQLFLAGLDGQLRAASPQLTPLAVSPWSGSPAGNGFYRVKGASADLSRLLFHFWGGGSVKLTADELLPSPKRSNLYMIEGATGPDPQLRIVNRADGAGGAIIGGLCGAGLGTFSEPGGAEGAYRAVSIDGSVVYFSSRPTASTSTPCPDGGGALAASPKRIFKRVNSTSTVEVSAAQCTPTPACPGSPNGDDTYEGASADGEVVFFRTNRRLLNSDTDSTADLYLYDESPPAGEPKLVQVSAGEAVAQHPTPGNGAKVQGTIDNSEDGSRVYFVAEARLTEANAQSKAPLNNRKNLYVYERSAAQPSGRIAFLGELASGDSSEWASTTGVEGGKASVALPVIGGAGPYGDGRRFGFVTEAKLASEDTDSAADLYLYDDGATEAAKLLRCLTCAGNGGYKVEVFRRPTTAGEATYTALSRIGTPDGSAFAFASAEPLLPEDENDAWDAYVWHEGGGLELISGATGSLGIVSSPFPVAISADGKGVVFMTRAALVGADTNNAADAYIARIGGGFPEAGSRFPCTEEAACRATAPQEPTGPASPGSEALRGAGNVVETKPKRCPRGKVRKGGKCVKKAAKAKKQHKGKKKHKGKAKKKGKRAGTSGGAGR